MKKSEKEICGVLIMEDEARQVKKIVVLQDSDPIYHKEKAYRKTFRLGSVHGDPVYPTEDLDIFQLSDGTLLKRRRR